jgi:cysteine desulfurase/selenocysteine lyase
MEHHSNIVPWQLLCERSGARLRVLPIDDAGELMLDRLPDLFTDRTCLLALTQVSNALGTVNPVRDLVALAHARGVPVLVDGAQAVAHMAVDVQDLDCDFYAFSGHKLYGPTGIGVLYGKREWLERLPPWQGGGEMIHSVSFAGSTWADLPYKFEAGTPDISGSIGLAAAIDYVRAVGLAAIAEHERDLLAHATEQALDIPGLGIVGTARHKAGILSFVLEGVHPHDIGTVLDHEGVAVRTGHHCAMPVMTRYGIPATVRTSFGLYNTHAEADALIAAVRHAREMFRP